MGKLRYSSHGSISSSTTIGLFAGEQRFEQVSIWWKRLRGKCVKKWGKMVASQARTRLPDGEIWILFSIVAWPDNARVAQILLRASRVTHINIMFPSCLCVYNIFFLLLYWFCFDSFLQRQQRKIILDRWHTRERQAFFFGFMFSFLIVLERNIDISTYTSAFCWLRDV